MSEQSNEHENRLQAAMNRVDEEINRPQLPGVAQLKAILEDRGRTHGNFQDNAYVSQRLKATVREFRAQQDPPLPADMAEAVDMICLKLSRIVTGDPNTRDHWDDIAGYAQLIARRL